MSVYKKGPSKKLYKLFQKWTNDVDPKIVESLLLDGADPNYISEKDNWGLSYHTFIIACRKDDWIESVKILIEHGADVNAKFDDNGQLAEIETPLIMAIRHGEDAEEIQKLLVSSGAK
tara:strand:- start:206 stop:559 length:354 start_codon:yes stop_codon:yes gene_type:complete